MYKSLRTYGLLVASCFCLLSFCKRSQINPALSATLSEKYTFLDSTEAGNAIVVDSTEGFFEHISMLDMQIQGRSLNGCSDKASCREAYHEFLKTDVASFSDAEKVFLSAVMDSAVQAVKTLNPRLMNYPIYLGKLKGQHYGDGVYFTRDKAIYIPQNELNEANFDKVYAVMLHEIFHIISRYDTPLRDACYAEIGFQKRDKDIRYPSQLAERILTNPDGVTDDYYIVLKDGDKEIKATPIIISNSPKYLENRTSFFEYLQFDLYELKESDGTLEVQANKDGYTLLSPSLMASFFESIKDNTQYIIHPDEILADNFMLAVIAKSTNDYSKFSEEGLDLLKRIESILKKAH